MRDLVKAFFDSNGDVVATKSLVSGTSTYFSRHLNFGNIAESDGNGLVGAKIDTVSITVTVAIALHLGEEVGYGPYRNMLDETVGARVATFDSTKVFQGSLFNQRWFNNLHTGFKIRFTCTPGGGEIITCNVSLS